MGSNKGDSEPDSETLYDEVVRLRAENERLQRQLADAQRRVQQTLSGSPLLVRELDVRELADHFDLLRAEGVTDFRAYFDAHPGQVPRCVNMARVVYANRNLLDFYGAQNGEELQQALAHEMTPERWHIARDLMAAFAERRPLPAFETYVRTLHNEDRYLLTQVSYLTETDPPASRILFLSIDATQQKHAEIARREREMLYRRAIAAADAVAYQMNARTGSYDFLSPEIEMLTGYTVEEFTTQKWGELDGRSYMRGGLEGLHVGDAIALYREGKLPRWKADMSYRHRNGEWRWVSDSSVPIFNRNGLFLGSMGILLDITERKRLEEQLLQAQKMESLGRLAGGIAHDFNNLLAIILGFAELAEADLASDDPLCAHLTKIQAAAQRGREITDRLLVFAHKQVFTPQTLDLGKLVHKAGDLMRSLAGSGVILEVRQEPDLWPVLAHAGQFEQVLFNLVVNARDAMPEGGTLTLSLRNVEVTPKSVGITPDVNPSEFVCLTVSDTGTGMSAEVKKRIFEPFFTTKPIGQGTGLGLTMVYSIVTQSGGHIEVESEAGRGTTIHIYMPRIFGPLTEQAGLQVTGQVEGTETILLVEDEVALREMAANWLQRRGYTVLQAANGVEALAVAAQYAAPIHLLLSDMVMPEMDGLELARRLGPLRPEMKILFISGYPGDPRFRHGEAPDDQTTNDIVILPKPYSLSQLEFRVREALDSPPPLTADDSRA